MRLDRYLLERQTIALNREVANWQEAVRLSVQLLEDNGAVTSEYYDAILENHAKNGPYFVIVPSVAMPHAAPERGVNATGFSLVTLKNPVRFGHQEHDPVDIVLCIAAEDRKSLNEETIIQVMDLLDHDDTVPKLRAARSLDDIESLFQNLFSGE